MSPRESAIAYAADHNERFVEELRALLAIPSISTLSAHGPDVLRTAGWLADQLRELRMENVDIMPTGGYPVVYGDWLHAKGKPTVIVYGHYDVQPPDPLDEWDTPPFEPTERDGFLYARGASDMKSQIFALLKAVEAIVKQGDPPVNLKFILEGEEEVGSPNLEGFLKEHKEMFSGDVVLNCDSQIFAPDRPSMVCSLRGLAYFELHVRGAQQDLHSGMFGGVIDNPANVLCRAIAKMHDEDGRVALPGFYDGVRELTDEDRAEIAEFAKTDAQWIEMAGAPCLHGEKGYTPTERVGARPTLDVNGILSGFTDDGSKTVLPAEAMAKISCRLVADQDPVTAGKQMEQFLAKHMPETVTWELRQLAGARPGHTDRSTVWMSHAKEAMKTVFGKEPFFIRQGGTIPIVGLMKEILGLDTVLMGFGLPGDRIHGPNERQYLPNFKNGVETYIHFLHRLGDRQSG